MRRIKFILRCIECFATILLLLVFSWIFISVWVIGFFVVLFKWANGDDQWSSWLHYIPLMFIKPFEKINPSGKY